MLRTLALALLVAARGYDEPTAVFPLGVHLRVDPSITSTYVVDGLKAEAAALWAPYGVRLEWVDVGGHEPPLDGITLDASLERESPRAELPAVLGNVTVTSDAREAQPIRLSFDATEAALARRSQQSGGNMHGVVSYRDLARALGRVLAHEIGHVLLSAPFHATAGLMRASFSVDQLARVDRTAFRLTCGNVDRLRARLSALAGDSQVPPQSHSTPGPPCIATAAKR